jgi:hypothetical protein
MVKSANNEEGSSVAQSCPENTAYTGCQIDADVGSAVAETLLATRGAPFGQHQQDQHIENLPGLDRHVDERSGAEAS